ncbi:amidohydrolase family protein [Microbacteriaceae bacterium VKM Ac-2854]|nr:amidohydrolase family protein [Microbacteriaceae bacterium VKM Ac-2854]
MTELLYDGPIIDAHTHLWDLSNDDYPWLMPTGSFGPKGRLDVLKGKDYLLENYRTDIAGCGVVASVHVEALFDPAKGLINETVWLETLDKSDNLAIRYTVGVAFGAADTERDIRAQAAFGRTKAVRQVIAWTPHPDRRMVPEADLARDPVWREAIPVLIELGLALEVLMYPWQAENVAELAADFPQLQIIVDHIGSPIEQDEAGLVRWREGITVMAAQPNVAVKASAAAAYLTEKTPAGIIPFVDHLVESFGADRVMFGSDFPVGTLVGWSYSEYLDAYRAAVRGLSRDEQEAVFFRTAARIYDIDIAELEKN